MNRLVATAAVGLLLAGCAKVGKPVYKQDYDQAKVGQSTVSEVIAVFGQPTSVLRGTGEVELTWEWSNTEVKGESFIPGASLVGAAGTKGRKGTVVALFSDDGILRRLRQGGAEYDTSGGSIFQGYETTGNVKAVDNALPEREASKPATKCRPVSGNWNPQCASNERCIVLAGKDYGYCTKTNADGR